MGGSALGHGFHPCPAKPGRPRPEGRRRGPALTAAGSGGRAGAGPPSSRSCSGPCCPSSPGLPHHQLRILGPKRAEEGSEMRGALQKCAQTFIPRRPPGTGPSPQRHRKTLSLFSPLPQMIKEQDTGMTVMQNVLYKSCNEPAGGGPGTVPGSPSSPHPSTRRAGRGGGSAQPAAGEGSTWGSKEVESALGGGPRLRRRAGRRTGVGSGRQRRAAKPSIWDQGPRPTSITPRLWLCVEGAHVRAQRPKGRPVASLGVLFPCPG